MKGAAAVGDSLAHTFCPTFSPMMLLPLRPYTAILWLAVVASLGCAQDLDAALDYGTFRGAYSEQYNISYWQKIPFAAPPVGDNR